MNCGNGHSCGCSSTSAEASRAGAAAIGAGPARNQTFRAPASVVETADKYQITLDVPGSSPEGIAVSLHEGVLSVVARVAPRAPEGARPIHTEYGVGDYRRQFRVADDVDAGAINAAYAQGVLTIDLPKARKAQARKVPVNAG